MDELNEIINGLPDESPEDMEQVQNRLNAYVFFRNGELCIYLGDGGALAIDQEDFYYLKSDVAPFHG